MDFISIDSQLPVINKEASCYYLCWKQTMMGREQNFQGKKSERKIGTTQLLY